MSLFSIQYHINKASLKAKTKYVTQYVEQGGYKGEVHCYTEKFLDEYFDNQMEKNFSPEPDELDDLPF